MRTLIWKGIRTAAWFYLAGGLITLTIHFIFGWENRAFYPASFLSVIVMGLVALPWVFYNVFYFLCPVNRQRNFGEFISHIVFFLITFITLLLT